MDELGHPFDIKGAIDHLIQHTEIKGPVNFVAPEPVLSKEFTSTLAAVLNRPHLFPVPQVGIRNHFWSDGR